MNTERKIVVPTVLRATILYRHLGFCSWAHTPTFRGYSSFYGYYTGGEDYYTHHSGGGYDFRLDATPNCGADCSHVAWEDHGLYSTHLLTTRVRARLHPPPLPLLRQRNAFTVSAPFWQWPRLRIKDFRLVFF